MKILGYSYQVQRSGHSDDLGASGRCHQLKQTIQIASNLTKEGAQSTLLHEILEALNYHLQLELGEGVIMSLESGLFQVLADNGVDLSPLLREEKCE